MFSKKIVSTILFCAFVLFSSTKCIGETSNGLLAYDNLISQVPKEIGSGDLNYLFGIKLYRARLISNSAFDSENVFGSNFALEINYFQSWDSSTIARRSLKEIIKLGYSDEEKNYRWKNWMTINLPTVKEGDLVSAFFSPETGIQLFLNEKFYSSSNDLEFTRAFFSIWLDVKTSEPSLRKKLLNINE
ncbi:MAG: hypothetical protein CBC42_02815 [Betaproteobacteria bacterium TMED82]|nr:MAG: hypothetical protein CBC42_02815 [Betaproteobacteria bacterium TMED82]|tara:strand:+ start:6459 stop:7022 length:564 start_codon:yes stop_codon:yes gene_type:complete